MSDPVTNVEIEDVLSSIRRLVSADDRPEKEAIQENAAADKLVLTPALRVDNDAAPESDDTASDEIAEETGPEAASGDQQASDDHIEAAQTGEDDAPEDVWDNPADQEDMSQQDAPHEEASEDENIEDTAAGESSEMPEELEEEAVDVAAETIEMPGPASDFTAHLAEIEEAVAARQEDWEPDGDLGDANAAQPMTALSWQDHLSADTDQPEGPMVAAETEGLDPFVPEDDPADDAEFYAEEVAAGDTDPVAEPGNAFLAEDDLLEDSAEAILDEEALRDLVAEIVRQELQGSLGERITRNVRKLVRREIQRALATQELD